MKVILSALAVAAGMGLAAVVSATPAAAATCTYGAEHFNFTEMNCVGAKLPNGWMVSYKDTGGGDAIIPEGSDEYCGPQRLEEQG